MKWRDSSGTCMMEAMGANTSRWTTVLDHLVGALPYEGRLVLINGPDLLADRLAEHLRDTGRPCIRLTAGVCADPEDGGWPALTSAAVVVAGPEWRDRVPDGVWHLTVWARTRHTDPPHTTPPHTEPPNAEPSHTEPSHTEPSHTEPPGESGQSAHVVLDLHDVDWPVIRHIDPELVPNEVWYRSESRAFFAARAATWDTKFGADLPAYAAAIAESDLLTGGVAVDVGCGTGRALPALRDAVGPAGTVFGVDHTPQMLATARDRARECGAMLLQADARHLPFAPGSVDAIFAAGLINHLPSAASGLRELARIARTGARLVLFHPSGRASLAARHGRTLHPDEPLAEHVLRATTADTGWRLTVYDDAEHRFLAAATRA
ncbi:class I SAM-dependent methyltransferase [Actinoplanes sp. NPDC051851]|uniref:class I SAM-dependent methyltransferase n=1 Tax=Actinoplanes sp. NPDC051851 TaxID=3154753 RepID=UPI003441285B